MVPTLEIKNLHVNVAGKTILQGVNLTIKSGEIHALLGPNGHGKSTLLNAIMGHPNFEVTEGSIFYDGQDVLKLGVDERAHLGLFLVMQAPTEVPGVVESDFLRAAINAKTNQPVPLFKFLKELDAATKSLNFNLDVAQRYLNEGFSGGEKKRNELLQMLLLNPSLVLFDELDSGLDVDALNTVTKVINEYKHSHPDFACIIVSHYAHMYELVKPTKVHIMVNGKIVLEGDESLIKKVNAEGYEWLQKEHGIKINKDVKPIVLGSCGVKVKK